MCSIFFLSPSVTGLATFLRTRPQIVDFQDTLSTAHGNFEQIFFLGGAVGPLRGRELIVRGIYLCNGFGSVFLPSGNLLKFRMRVLRGEGGKVRPHLFI
jgi:hypothetical protein